MTRSEQWFILNATGVAEICPAKTIHKLMFIACTEADDVLHRPRVRYHSMQLLRRHFERAQVVQTAPELNLAMRALDKQGLHKASVGKQG